MSGVESGAPVLTNHSERTIERVAPAKVNLTLAVLGQRVDGYHELESWVVKLAWWDRLTVRSGPRSLTVDGPVTGIPCDGGNLALRAGRLFAETVKRPANIAIRLWKEIPAGGGLGGGSSDAASVLLALNELWGLDWRIEQLTPLAAAIGSDVPLFLQEGAAVIRGRGEIVQQLSDCWRGWLAIVIPPYSVPTAEVYRRRSACGDGGTRSSAPTRPWQSGCRDAFGLMKELFNDLEPAAFAVEPRLRRLHERLDGLGGRPVRMTGSGSCLFSLFDAESDARGWGEAASKRLENGERIHVTATI
jgi:4-diphosphocytidyl-2-C-methyl-D-erythritol kinase